MFFCQIGDIGKTLNTCSTARKYLRSWNVPELKLPEYVCFGRKFGLAMLVVSDHFSKIRDIGGSKREMYSRSFRSRSDDGRVRSLRMSPKSSGRDVEQEPKDFQITSDFNVELGLLFTDEDDNWELNEMDGP